MNAGRPATALLIALLPALVAVGVEPTALFSTDGYRIAEFMAPVPEDVPGAITLGTDSVRALIEPGDTAERGEAVLIDVLPAPPKPEGLAPAALWMPPERRNIPGSFWLPNVGYGALSRELENYFRSNLQRLTGGNRGRILVIYCLADCWMSWNAARRAVQWGYTAVRWYPEGTTGWEEAGLPLETATPVPLDQTK